MSSSGPQSPRHRAKSSKKAGVNGHADSDETTPILDQAQQAINSAGTTDWDYKVGLAVVSLLAFVTRFYGLSHPDQVVFDEVHFGKFASLYLQRTYFFDVHPPFGKLLFALAGWLVGYNGEFLFDNIGDSYIKNRVPYVAYRSMPALLGSMTVSVVYLIMWESGYSLPACMLATALVLFDNAHIGQTRLILLDATLIFFMAVSILCYIRFYKLRHIPFTRKWWKWLSLTGISMSCVISVKYVGAFTFFSIGVPVMIDLWDLLDINRRQGALSLQDFLKHLMARAVGLIIVPFLVYLFWFQVHFAILTRSGPGDDFMTPEFQETLSDNLLLQQSVGINYFDFLTIRHKDTRMYLHSHTDTYPLRYEDGRISSQGQQVTGYPHNDTNNQWEILPTRPMRVEPGQPVRNGDNVRLRHVVTNTILLTHDVASPYFPTNQEFTTVDPVVAKEERFNDTIFEIRIENGKFQQEFRTMASHFKLVHMPTKVAMWTHTKPLPDWGYGQAEINGNKNVLENTNLWFIEDIPLLPKDHERRKHETRVVKSLPFFQKYLELQRAMFYHNNALTASHPYSSQPSQWPFLLRGVSFWTDADTKQQIYFLGNPIGWWLTSSLLAVFAGIIGADQVSLRRGVDALDERTRIRLYNSTGFFFLVWAAHYIPFYVMGRQLFLHHYLPAHLASALVTGALLEFVFNVEPVLIDEAFDDKGRPKRPAGGPRRHRPIRERLGDQSMFVAWSASGALLSVVLWGFWFFAPLTYGQPGLEVSQVLNRKWLNYDLHFAK